jgi:hypothetical protein
MSRIGNFGSGIGLAAIAAGPTFVLTAVLADLYLRLPAPLIITPQSVVMLLWFLGPATIVGAIIALPVNAIGALAMRMLGEWFAPARTRAAWILAGGLLGGLGVWLLEAEHPLNFALVATAAFCGWLCSANAFAAERD